jgi:hypothetical protein
MRLPSVRSVPSHGLVSALMPASTAASVPLLAPTPARAQLAPCDPPATTPVASCTIELNGQSWEVGTRNAVFDSSTATGWFGNEDTAKDAARQVGFALGRFLGRGGGEGLYFGFSVDGSIIVTVSACFWQPNAANPLAPLLLFARRLTSCPGLGPQARLPPRPLRPFPVPCLSLAPPLPSASAAS